MRIELVLKSTPCDAKLETPVGKQIGQCRLTRHSNWMPVRRHHRRGAQSDRAGMLTPIDEQGERIGSDRQLNGVMLSRPGRMKPGPFGHLQQIQMVTHHITHILLR